MMFANSSLYRYDGDSEHLVVLFYFIVDHILNGIQRAMMRDEEIYPDPDSFRPERFFNDDGTLNNDTAQYVFGFGRRYVVFEL